MTSIGLPIGELLLGDLLIFSRPGLFDWIIKVKTWSQACHTEIYIGNGKTVASRNGQGCAIYDVDLSGLYCVRRPVQKFDLIEALGEFKTSWEGKPYGWLSLLSFVLIDVHDNGCFCSELSTLIYRAGGFEPFTASIHAETCAPSDFLYVSDLILKTIWRKCI